MHSLKKLYSNFINSLNGLGAGLKEHSFVMEVIGGVVLIPYAVIANLELFFKISIIAVYFILLAFELLNTSIEKLSDKITTAFDEDIKKIKDLSSAAVFLVLLVLVSLIIISFII